MKKLFSVLFTLCIAVSMYASYGILVNGKTYFAGTQVDDNDGYQQHLAHVSVKAGDYCQLYDLDNKAAWAVTLDTWSVKGNAHHIHLSHNSQRPPEEQSVK